MVGVNKVDAPLVTRARCCGILPVFMACNITLLSMNVQMNEKMGDTGTCKQGWPELLAACLH